MVTYSSYLKKDDSIIQPALSIVGMNLFISIFAGLAIFPAVFSLGFEPTAGPGLLFIVLPSVFEQMVFGNIFLLIFLVLFLFAALTSAFSLLEIVVAAVTQGKGGRNYKTWIIGILVFVLGVPSALSYGILSDVTIVGKSIFDVADYLVSNILMPIGAFLISIFVSYKMKKDVLKNELIHKSKFQFLFEVWYLLLQFIIPIVIIIVFLDVIDVI